MIMKNLFLTLIMAAVLSFGLTSCKVLESVFGSDTVVTTSDQVKEGADTASIPFDQLPDALKEKFSEEEDLVMVAMDALKEGASFVQLGGILTDGGLEGLIATGLGVAGAFFPSLAAWEGALLFMSRRKRKHWLSAIKALLPMDKTVDIGGTVASIGAAIGLAHSSESSAAAFEKEA